jgi:hypothetical protein
LDAASVAAWRNSSTVSKYVNIGRVEVPSCLPIFCAVIASTLLSRITSSAAATICSFVNFGFGGIGTPSSCAASLCNDYSFKSSSIRQTERACESFVTPLPLPFRCLVFGQRPNFAALCRVISEHLIDF